MLLRCLGVLILGTLFLNCAKKKTAAASVAASTASVGVTCPEGSNSRRLIQDVSGGPEVPGAYIENVEGSKILSISFRHVLSVVGVYFPFVFQVTVKECDFGGAILSTTSASVATLEPSVGHTLKFTF